MRAGAKTHVEMSEDTLDLDDRKWRLVKRRLTWAGVQTHVQKVLMGVVEGQWD